MDNGRVLITGNSSGLGEGLSQVYLEKGWQVYGCSRRGCALEGVQDIRLDLSDFDAVPLALCTLLDGVEGLDLVVLNAGVLGEIRDLHETPVEQLREIMEINVWANKVIMDWLHQWGRSIGQVVMISSGASVLGNRGWSGYALSKATLNMLAKLYSHEFPETHIAAIAPGLIDSAMMDYLCDVPDPDAYPALVRLRGARGTETMPDPYNAARRIVTIMEKIRDYPSGSFIDIRQMLEPLEYAKLMGHLNQPR
jgi:benzil reductase ((S)-benzoin forming)